MEKNRMRSPRAAKMLQVFTEYSESNVLKDSKKGPNSPPRKQDGEKGHLSELLTISGEEARKFDLMHVNITIYSVYGIISKMIEPSSRKTRKSLSRSESMTKSPISFSKNLETPKVDSHQSTWSMKETETGVSEGIPTTAIVSCKRNVLSSGTAIETFIPSAPLSRVSCMGSNVSRYKANWSEDESSVLLERSKPQKYAFEVIRAMQREYFEPGKSIGQITNYVHETVDIKVSVGRGKEIIELGTASIAVSGDEEGEVIVNVPVRRTQPPHANLSARKQRGRKKKERRDSFSSNLKELYSLDDNAILRVGVQVSHQQLSQRNDVNREDEGCLVADKSLGSFLESILDENLVIELSDENSLLERIVAHQMEIETEEQARMEESNLVQKEAEPVLPGFFCGVLSAFTAESSSETVPTDVEVRRNDRLRIPAARVLPLSLVSSVSESTDDESSTNTQDFPPQRAVL